MKTKRIAHISDTHIRNLKYHDEYRHVFNQIYDSLKQEQRITLSTLETLLTQRHNYHQSTSRWHQTS